MNESLYTLRCIKKVFSIFWNFMEILIIASSSVKKNISLIKSKKNQRFKNCIVCCCNSFAERVINLEFFQLFCLTETCGDNFQNRCQEYLKTLSESIWEKKKNLSWYSRGCYLIFDEAKFWFVRFLLLLAKGVEKFVTKIRQNSGSELSHHFFKNRLWLTSLV